MSISPCSIDQACAAQVVEVAVERPDGDGLVRAGEHVGRVLGKAEIPAGVTCAYRGLLVRPEVVAPELAECFEEAVARSWSSTSCTIDLSTRFERRGHLRRAELLVGAHASAASRPKPPNTPSRPNRHCSSASRRSYDHATRSCSVRWRDHRRLGALEQVEALVEPFREAAGLIARTRAAASSMPSGSPSTRRTISATASVFSGVNAKPRRGRRDEQTDRGDSATVAALARCSNRSGPPATVSPGSRAPLGSSPARSARDTNRGAVRRGARPRRASARSCRGRATAAARRNSTSVSSTERCCRCCTSTAVAIAATVAAESRTGASSTKNTSPPSSSQSSFAQRSASASCRRHRGL